MADFFSNALFEKCAEFFDFFTSLLLLLRHEGEEVLFGEGHGDSTGGDDGGDEGEDKREMGAQ